MRAAPILGLVLVLSACGGDKGAKLMRANQGLSIALQATSAARDGFIAWDRAKQEAIVEAAKTPEEGRVALVAYRARRLEVSKALVIAYSSIALASSSLVLYDADRLTEKDVIVRLVEAAAATRAAIDAVRAAGAMP